MTTKADWIEAKAALDMVEMEREQATAAIRKKFEEDCAVLLAPTDAGHAKARARLEEIEEEIGEPLSACEGCSQPIFEGERYCRGDDVDLCENCAPTYRDMLSSPESFLDSEGESLSEQEAKRICDAHVAAGGSLDDKHLVTM